MTEASTKLIQAKICLKIAGSMALEDAFKNSDPILLEPIMKVEVSTPDEIYGRCNRRLIF